MDEAHLRAALRYVALNPVRARPAARAEATLGRDPTPGSAGRSAR
jgi:hypothetical protein